MSKHCFIKIDLLPSAKLTISASQVSIYWAFGKQTQLLIYAIFDSKYTYLKIDNYTVERCKYIYELIVIGVLSGRALTWANAIWTAGGHLCSSYTTFTGELKTVFPPRGGLRSWEKTGIPSSRVSQHC